MTATAANIARVIARLDAAPASPEIAAARAVLANPSTVWPRQVAAALAVEGINAHSIDAIAEVANAIAQGFDPKRAVASLRNRMTRA